jgi:hypothetical protein
MESRKWLINDVPDGPGDRCPDGPRTIAALVAALATALLTAAFSGCGGGGSESSTSTSASVSTTRSASAQTPSTRSTTTSTTATVKEANHPPTPTAAVRLLLLSSTPQTGCSSDVVTQHYLRAAYGGRGACLKAVSSKNAAKSLAAVGTRIIDGTVMVTVHPIGGIYDGEKITVSLIKNGAGWQVDGIKSNAPVGP